MFMLVAHFRLDDPAEPLRADARAALSLLAAAPECRRLSYARSTDDAGRAVLVAEFDSAAAYRRALSPFEARTVLVPWLSTADVESSGVSEVLVSATDGRIREEEPTVQPPIGR